MKVEVYIVYRSDNSNQFVGMFLNKQDAKDAIVKQYANIGVCTFTDFGSKLTTVAITNTLNTLVIEAMEPHSGPAGLRGY